MFIILTLEAFDFTIEDVPRLLQGVNPSIVHVLFTCCNILLPGHVLH